MEQEDFGDFEEARWIAFPDAQVQSFAPQLESDTDWSADFHSSPAHEDEAAVADSTSDDAIVSMEGILADMVQLLGNLYQSRDEQANNVSRHETLNLLISELEDNSQIPTVGDGHCSCMWLSLRSIEDSLALKYQWSNSSSFRNLAASLRIDISLAKLRCTNLPAFAWHLGSSALIPTTVTNQTDDHVPARQGSETARQVDDPSKDGISNIVQFPSSGILDSEFLDPQVTGTGHSSDGNSSLVFLATSETSDATMVPSQVTMDHVHVTISHIDISTVYNESTNSCLSKENVSSESMKVLGELPVLSFMLSPVLMFPVREHGNYNS